jgi:integrase
MSPTTTLPALIAAYESYCSRRGRATGTLRQYRPVLNSLAVWAGDRDPRTLVAADIEMGWLTGWCDQFQARRGRPPAPKTVRNALTAVKSFFGFCQRYGFITPNPAAGIDLPRIEPKFNDWLTPDEDAAVIAACRSPQERIVIPMLRFTGLRASELTGLTNEDVDLRAGVIVVRHSKTPRGRRTIPIVPELEPFIQAWIRFQTVVGRAAPASAFLSTRHGTGMGYAQVYDTVKRVATRAGVRRRLPPDREGINTSAVTPHTLRRTFGSSWLNQGLRLEVVSRLLGHESTVTTERSYAALLDSTIAAEVLNVAPTRPIRLRAEQLTAPASGRRDADRLRSHLTEATQTKAKTERL